MQFENLSSDQLYDLLRHSRYEDVAYLCRTNRDFAELCRSPRGIEVINQLKQQYRLNLANQIIKKIENPVHFFYTLDNFSSHDKNLSDDYHNILYNKVMDLLDKNEPLLHILFVDFNLPSFDHCPRLEHFLDLYKIYYGGLHVNDIIYLLRSHSNLIPLLNNITRDAIRVFLLKHPEILVPLLNYFGSEQ